MASDATKKLEDESLEPSGLGDSLKAASPILIKFIEMLFGLLCFCLIFVPHDNHLSSSVHKSGLVWTAYLFTIFVNIVVLTSHFRSYPLPKFSLYMFSLFSTFLVFIAGCILLSEWWIFMHSIRFIPPKMFMDLMMSCAFFSFLLFGITIADLYVTYKYY